MYCVHISLFEYFFALSVYIFAHKRGEFYYMRVNSIIFCSSECQLQQQKPASCSFSWLWCLSPTGPSPSPVSPSPSPTIPNSMPPHHVLFFVFGKYLTPPQKYFIVLYSEATAVFDILGRRAYGLKQEAAVRSKNWKSAFRSALCEDWNSNCEFSSCACVWFISCGRNICLFRSQNVWNTTERTPGLNKKNQALDFRCGFNHWRGDDPNISQLQVWKWSRGELHPRGLARFFRNHKTNTLNL